MTGVPAPTGPMLPPPSPWYGKFWVCEAYDCVDLELPPHTHVLHPWSDGTPGGVEGTDIDRVYIDWPAVAYEQWTGRRRLPVGQLDLFQEVS